jgi:ElaB/YqjD/DUF883 family membrane-anchored ribosome-binding protein
VDIEALQRTKNSTELSGMRSMQMEERDRFLQYQKDVLDKLRSQNFASRSQVVKDSREAIEEATQKVRDHPGQTMGLADSR